MDFFILNNIPEWFRITRCLYRNDVHNILRPILCTHDIVCLFSNLSLSNPNIYIWGSGEGGLRLLLMLSFLWLLYFKEHNFQMYLIYKAKKLKKLKIVKLKKFKPNIFGCLPSSGITNPTFYRANSYGHHNFQNLQISWF